MVAVVQSKSTLAIGKMAVCMAREFLRSEMEIGTKAALETVLYVIHPGAPCLVTCLAAAVGAVD
jgi:hypothetical protein